MEFVRWNKNGIKCPCFPSPFAFATHKLAPASSRSVSHARCGPSTSTFAERRACVPYGVQSFSHALIVQSDSAKLFLCPHGGSHHCEKTKRSLRVMRTAT